MNKKGKHILLLFTYIVLTATLYFLQDINKGFFMTQIRTSAPVTMSVTQNKAKAPIQKPQQNTEDKNERSPE